MAIQIASNFFNDAIDSRKGADTAQRLGPLRATASGLLKPTTVLGLALLAMLVAALWAWPLIAARGWVILAIGIPSLYFSFGYTGGPYPLAYRGLGECFVLLFFGLIAVTGTVFVQSGQFDPWAILLGAQVGALSTVLIAINNLRDSAEDSQTGKRTLAVRFGVPWAKNEITLLLLMPFVIGSGWLFCGQPGFVFGPLLAAPGALYVMRRIRTDNPGPGHNRLLALAGVILIVFALGFHLSVIV